MAELIDGSVGPVSRRRVLKVGTSAAGAALIPGFFGQIDRAYADDKPPLGTWPAGSEGDTVTIGATVPRTGTYAAQGEDELKGMQLAVEHIERGQRSDQTDRPQTDERGLRQTDQSGRRGFSR